MGDYQERNSKILKMRGEGKSLREISRRFGLSVKRIRQIVLRFEVGKESQEKSENIRERFRSSDDIEKKWPKDMIIDGILFPKMVTWRLQRYFESHEIQEISLRDLMDFLIPELKRWPAYLREVVPAFKENQFGRKTVYTMVHHLSEQDLGDTFNTEWAKRLESLMRYLIRTGQNVPLLLRNYL